MDQTILIEVIENADHFGATFDVTAQLGIDGEPRRLTIFTARAHAVGAALFLARCQPAAYAAWRAADPAVKAGKRDGTVMVDWSVVAIDNPDSNHPLAFFADPADATDFLAERKARAPEAPGHLGAAWYTLAVVTTITFA